MKNDVRAVHCEVCNIIDWSDVLLTLHLSDEQQLPWQSWVAMTTGRPDNWTGWLSKQLLENQTSRLSRQKTDIPECSTVFP